MTLTVWKPASRLRFHRFLMGDADGTFR
jgi:hypothetical protein